MPFFVLCPESTLRVPKPKSEMQQDEPPERSSVSKILPTAWLNGDLPEYSLLPLANHPAHLDELLPLAEEGSSQSSLFEPSTPLATPITTYLHCIASIFGLSFCFHLYLA